MVQCWAGCAAHLKLLQGRTADAEMRQDGRPADRSRSNLVLDSDVGCIERGAFFAGRVHRLKGEATASPLGQAEDAIALLLQLLHRFDEHIRVELVSAASINT